MNMSEMLDRKLPEIPVAPDPLRPHPHTSVGIEVELEGVTISRRANLKRWEIVGDGSLQDGCEFVSLPVWGTAITDALEELQDVLAEYTPHVSFRTSVHVHINILDMDLQALAKMIQLYIIYEPALFRLHDNWDRKNNIFCVPCRKSRAIFSAYSALLRDLNHNRYRGGYLRSKYCAMNINSVGTLGTLEFRHMGGTTEVNKIDSWINILLQLKVAALSDVDIFNVDEVWGPYRNNLDVQDKDIESGVELINQLSMWG